MTTLLIADHDNATLKDATAKALSAASALGSEIHILVAGKDCAPAAQAAANLEGVAKVLHADADNLEHQLAEPIAALVVSLADGYDEIVLLKDMQKQLQKEADEDQDIYDKISCWRNVVLPPRMFLRLRK